MTKPTHLVPLLLGAIIGCSNNVATDPSPPAEFLATPNLVVQASAAPAALPLVADRGKDKKADKPKDASDLPAGWYADYAQALARAKSTGQPLLVLFH
jgi:hypothetical protein